MICSRCQQDKTCLHFKEFGNDGTKSYVRIVPMCKDCMDELHFIYDDKELNWK